MTKPSSIIADTIIRALKRASRAEIKPFNWTFYSADGSEVVNFRSDKVEARFTYTKTTEVKFLWFVIRTDKETLTMGSHDDFVDFADWMRVGAVSNEIAARFGENA